MCVAGRAPGAARGSALTLSVSSAVSGHFDSVPLWRKGVYGLGVELLFAPLSLASSPSLAPSTSAWLRVAAPAISSWASVSNGDSGSTNGDSDSTGDSRAACRFAARFLCFLLWKSPYPGRCLRFSRRCSAVMLGRTARVSLAAKRCQGAIQRTEGVRHVKCIK